MFELPFAKTEWSNSISMKSYIQPYEFKKPAFFHIVVSVITKYHKNFGSIDFFLEGLELEY